MQFVAENINGCKITIEPSTGLGGSGKNPNPIDYLMASLGGCVGIKVVMGLSKRGIEPNSLTIKIDGARRKTPPEVFEKIHLVITLTGDLEDSVVTEVIQETITLTCPVAVMLGKEAEISWEHRIIE